MINRPEEFLFDEEGEVPREDAQGAAQDPDPDFVRSMARWQQMTAGVRASLDADLPDRSGLVLYALSRVRPGVLTPEDEAALAAQRPVLEAAIRRHPGLEDVLRHIEASCVAFDEAWQQESGLRHDPPVRRAADRRPARARQVPAVRWMARGAIALAIVAFAAVSFLLVQRDRSLVTVRTAAGEVRVVELGDGSVVRLLENSAFSFADPSSGAVLSRHARLAGSAFFDIAPSQRGFVVETETAQATVLGTRFGVQAGADATEIVLARGRLTVSSKAAPREVIALAPGEMSRVVAGALPSSPVAVDVTEVLAWTGLFVFEATPLQQIAERLRAHFGRPIAVDPVLAAEPVTGTFEQSQPLREILDVIAATLGAEVRTQPDEGFLIVPARAS